MLTGYAHISTANSSLNQMFAATNAATNAYLQPIGQFSQSQPNFLNASGMPPSLSGNQFAAPQIGNMGDISSLMTTLLSMIIEILPNAAQRS
ncbi:MAG: hypothetical protein AAGI66_00580 [Cyanobacteria bacterium P01_H01_bin.74]